MKRNLLATFLIVGTSLYVSACIAILHQPPSLWVGVPLGFGLWLVDAPDVAPGLPVERRFDV